MTAGRSSREGPATWDCRPPAMLASLPADCPISISGRGCRETGPKGSAEARPAGATLGRDQMWNPNREEIEIGLPLPCLEPLGRL